MDKCLFVHQVGRKRGHTERYFWLIVCLFKELASCSEMHADVASPSLHKALIEALWAHCELMLHFKHSAVINGVASKTPLWQSQRGVITQDRSPTSAPDLCQRKMVTGIALGLSHVHYCLCLKRPQGGSDACWRTNRERQWETDCGGLGVEWR